LALFTFGYRLAGSITLKVPFCRNEISTSAFGVRAGAGNHK
jgi:hypothetical protein